MKSCSGSRHRPTLPCVHRLVPLSIIRRILASNVWRERNMPNLFKLPEKVLGWRKPNVPLAKAPARDHLRMKLVPLTLARLTLAPLPKEEMLPDPDLPP